MWSPISSESLRYFSIFHQHGCYLPQHSASRIRSITLDTSSHTIFNSEWAVFEFFLLASRRRYFIPFNFCSDILFSNVLFLLYFPNFRNFLSLLLCFHFLYVLIFLLILHSFFSIFNFLQFYVLLLYFYFYFYFTCIFILSISSAFVMFIVSIIILFISLPLALIFMHLFHPFTYFSSFIFIVSFSFPFICSVAQITQYHGDHLAIHFTCFNRLVTYFNHFHFWSLRNTENWNSFHFSVQIFSLVPDEFLNIRWDLHII